MSLFEQKNSGYTLFRYPDETNYKFIPSSEEYKKTTLKSRDDYYYIFGLKFLKKMTFVNHRPIPRFKTAKYANIDLEDKEAVISVYKNKFGMFAPKEYIPFEYWADHDSLQGEALSIINHPVFQYAEQYILADHQKTYDTLVVASCSDSKPYDQNANYFGIKSFCKGKADFAVLSNSGVIPLKFSYYYPFLHYNWNHSLETPELSEAFIYHSVLRLERFMKKFNYTKLIMIAPYGGVYWQLFNRLQGNFEKVFLMDESTWNNHFKLFKNTGMAKLRLFHSPYMNEKLPKLLGKTIQIQSSMPLEEETSKNKSLF